MKRLESWNFDDGLENLCSARIQLFQTSSDQAKSGSLNASFPKWMQSASSALDYYGPYFMGVKLLWHFLTRIVCQTMAFLTNLK